MTHALTHCPPDSIAKKHSDELTQLIKEEIERSGGHIDFATYMQFCLYAPGLGYYSAGSHKLGRGGDFTTAPEQSDLFSRTLARHCIDVLSQLNSGSILEFGAGSGKMATDILLELEQHQQLPEHYYIVDVSADLRDKQNTYIRTHAPHLHHRVIWLDNLPAEFTGVILANEVCDAMPVHLIHIENNMVSERKVSLDHKGDFFWKSSSISTRELNNQINNILEVGTYSEYVTEINLAAPAWIASLSESLLQGAVFIIDYGYHHQDYYHPQRHKGTLMCYYQHQAHDDPFFLPGLQDITAHVNFTALAETAHNHHFEVAGFQSQADFLLAGGITDLIPVSDHDDVSTMLTYANQIKQLTLPSTMGETFKVLTLTKALPELLPKVVFSDRRATL
jgi:SAM-dependent MidA family methyltransferase